MSLHNLKVDSSEDRGGQTVVEERSEDVMPVKKVLGGMSCELIGTVHPSSSRLWRMSKIMSFP